MPRKPSGVRYSEALWAQIVERIAAGETVQAMAAEPGMPSTVAFGARRRRKPAYDAQVREAYAKAGGMVKGDEAAWDRLIALVAAGADIGAVAGKNGLPTKWQWGARRKRDPEFVARADEALAATRRSGTPISDDRWSTIIERLRAELPSNSKITSDRSLPSFTTLHQRSKGDDEIAQILRREVLQPRQSAHRSMPIYQARDYEAVISGAQSGLSLAAMAREGLPSPATVGVWRRKNPDFDARLRAVSGVYRGLGEGDWRDGALLKRQLSQNELYAAVDRVLGPGLPPHVRDDVRSEMILAVLEGDMAESEITRQTAREFLAEYHRSAGSWKSNSMDGPAFSGSSQTLHDRLAS